MRTIRFMPRSRTRTVSVQRILVLASLATIVIIGLVVIFNFAAHKNASAATAGDYRAKATGNWQNIAKWERYNGTLWVAAIDTPTSADAVITIQSGYTSTGNASFTGEQLVVHARAS